MITRITGRLLHIEGLAATLSIDPHHAPARAADSAPSPGSTPGSTPGTSPGLAPGFEYEVLLPAYLAQRLETKIGQTISLVTLHYLEGQGQGTSFEPRLIGFSSREERRFFDLLTTVKGIGNKKALRALTVEPSVIAGAIVDKEPKTLQRLPEIGKRLAETIIAELSGKVEPYLSTGERSALDQAAAPKRGRAPAADQAVAALVALGEARAEAERLVDAALSKAKDEPTDADGVLALVYAAR